MFRPECAMKIALVLSNWAELEDRLAWFLSHAMSSVVERLTGSRLMFDPISYVTMESVDAIHTRLEIVEQSVISHVSTDHQREWESIRDRMRKIAKRRNVVVHTNWHVSDEFPGGLLREIRTKPPFGRTIELWEVRDFDELLAAMTALRGRLFDFTQAVGGDHP